MQTPKGEVDRRNFLKISTASTATAFGAFALAGNNAAMAYSTGSDTGSGTAGKASMSEEEIAALPRVKQELVAPPFAPEHEQVASGGPKVVEITMTCDEVRWQVNDDRRGGVGHDVQRHGSRPARRLPPGRLRRADAEEPVGLRHGAQHRLPRVHRSARGRSADPRPARPGDGAALQGDQAGRVRLSLRPRRRDDPLSRGARDERHHHGAAARGPDRRQGQPAPIRPRSSMSGSRTSTSRRTRTATGRSTTDPCRTLPTSFPSCRP